MIVILAENEAAIKSLSCITSQLYKERIKELIKKYSDKHKDLHGSISKIGKVIDKVNLTIKLEKL